MKLRMRGNSVRLRLLRAEVDALAKGEDVVESVAFAPGQKIEYAIASDPHGAAMRAAFDGTRVSVFVPVAMAREWGHSEVVGIEHDQLIGDGSMLQILIEKDFACLQPREGDEDNGTFANPKREAP